LKVFIALKCQKHFQIT